MGSKDNRALVLGKILCALKINFFMVANDTSRLPVD